MIANERHKKPILSFGKATRTAKFIEGFPVEVWQNRLFNTTDFDTEVELVGSGTIEKLSPYKWKITDTSGNFTLIPKVTNLATLEEITGDALEVEVVKPAFDSTLLTFDSTLYTFDNE